MKKIGELAISGGEAVRSTPWPTYDKGNVILDEDDIKSVIEVFQSNRLFRYDNRRLEETNVGLFEKQLTRFFKCNFALAVSSGTAALSLPLMALNLPENSWVGCPTYTFTATPSAIILAKHKPLLVEVDGNLHMDLIDLEKKIYQMRALVVVHMRGFPAPISQIIEIAKKHNVPVIEDAVPILGYKLGNQFLGTYGLAGAFSMQSDKSLNTGEGGFILTNEKDLYLKCAALSGAYEYSIEKHCHGENDKYDFANLPVFNFRLDELRGALALSQLKKLEVRLKILTQNYIYLLNAIQDLTLVKPRMCWDKNLHPIGDNLLLYVEGTIEDRMWFAQALSLEGIDVKSLGNIHVRNVRRFWDWDYLFDNMNKDEIIRCYQPSFNNINSYLDISLSPILTREDLNDLITALKKVHYHYEKRKSVE